MSCRWTEDIPLWRYVARSSSYTGTESSDACARGDGPRLCAGVVMELRWKLVCTDGNCSGKVDLHEIYAKERARYSDWPAIGSCLVFQLLDAKVDRLLLAMIVTNCPERW